MARQIIRFGSLALATALVLAALIWAPSSPSGQTVAAPKARSARLTLEQCHQLLQSGDWSRVENELEHLHQDLPAEDNHWNYGNVYHQSMTLNGLLALYKDHDLARAKAFLALSAQTPTSPQLLSFGPNMLLAKSLLEHGEFEAVDSYLAGCESFWLDGATTLQAWRAQLRESQVPDFGANGSY